MVRQQCGRNGCADAYPRKCGALVNASVPKSQQAQTSAVYAAVAVMTIAAHCDRRARSRATWMQYPNVGTSVQVRFAVRAGGFAKETVAALQREHAVHADMLLLFGVAAAEHVVRGRVLLLLEWLRVAPRLFPSAQWVVKADDDTYVITPEWETHLRLSGRGLRPWHGAMHGYLVWHNYDTKEWLPKSFSFSYSPGRHWTRAIDYLAGDKSAPRSAGEREELERCRGNPRGCQHCTLRDQCVGPFPFAPGWLMSLNMRLARAVHESPSIAADAAATANVTDGRHSPIFEDIWLGAALHQFLAHVPTRFVSGGDFHFFNGRWGPRGRDRNTTSVYHNRLTDEVHARVAERHLLSAPEMACSDEAADVNRHAERQFRNWQRYFDETNRTRHAYCSLAEPRYLGSDAAKLATLLAQEAGLGWLLHIASDELFLPEPTADTTGVGQAAGSARRHFAQLARAGCETFRYHNLEAVPEVEAVDDDASGGSMADPFARCSLFKRSEASLPRGEAAAAAVAFWRQRSGSDRLFHFHEDGRSAVRLDSDGRYVSVSAQAFLPRLPGGDWDRARLRSRGWSNDARHGDGARFVESAATVLHYPIWDARGLWQRCARLARADGGGQRRLGAAAEGKGLVAACVAHLAAHPCEPDGGLGAIARLFRRRVALTDASETERQLAAGALLRVGSVREALRRLRPAVEGSHQQPPFPAGVSPPRVEPSGPRLCDGVGAGSQELVWTAAFQVAPRKAYQCGRQPRERAEWAATRRWRSRLKAEQLAALKLMQTGRA